MADLIENVSDTALWVAVYRAEENERKDAIFRDPYAERLSGERGRAIAARMSGGPYVRWNVVMRTIIIDDLIRQLVAEGADVVVNLGTGLDTRPYRMNLPASLTWIEADYGPMIDYKTDALKNEKPTCKLERFSVDLADAEARREFFASVAARSQKIVVITEGVTPYLSEEQVGDLANDLHAHPSFKHWITDYNAPFLKKRIQTAQRQREMKNAPFKFYPDDWEGFYAGHGWKLREMRYIPQESLKHGRKFPTPWYGALLALFMPASMKKQFMTMSGYGILEPK